MKMENTRQSSDKHDACGLRHDMSLLRFFSRLARDTRLEYTPCNSPFHPQVLSHPPRSPMSTAPYLFRLQFNAYQSRKFRCTKKRKKESNNKQHEGIAKRISVEGSTCFPATTTLGAHLSGKHTQVRFRSNISSKAMQRHLPQPTPSSPQPFAFGTPSTICFSRTKHALSES